MANGDDTDDTAAFRTAMRGVRPLKGDPPAAAGARQPLRPRAAPPRRPDANQQARRAAALGRQDERVLVASDHTPERAPEEWLAWCGPGVQQALFRQLRTGRLPPEATLDLHGMRLDEAGREVPAFIDEAIRRGCRVVRVVHGKGGREDARNAPLKSHVAEWLKQLDGVLAYHSALPTDGGAGALYVLLRRLRPPVAE